MAGNDVMESWEQIRLGVGDVEKLIGQKSYNLAMVKARQTLEIMVKSLMARYNVQASDLREAIDNLYERHVISQKTRDNYHEIRRLGNGALHEADASVNNANEAYHLLSQEVYTFANSVKRRSSGSGARRKAAKRRKSSGGIAINPIFAIVAAIVAVIVIIVIIKLTTKEKPVETQPETIEMTIEYVSIEETEAYTVPETTTAAPDVWVTIDYVNVRKEPNTDCDRWGVLDPDTVVEYIEDYDETWAKINYQGNEGYVSKEYIKKQ